MLAYLNQVGDGQKATWYILILIYEHVLNLVIVVVLTVDMYICLIYYAAIILDILLVN